MMEKKQLNVRIPADIYDKIESSGRSKQDIVADALMLYFDSKMQQTNESNNNTLVQTLQDEVKYLRGKLDELTKLLHQEQSLHLQTQRLLPEPEREIKNKQWWQFWRK